MALQIPDPRKSPVTSTPLAVLIILAAVMAIGALLYVYNLGALVLIFVPVLIFDDFRHIWPRKMYTLPYNTLH
ncbi:MAG: hypothetical protein WCW31_04685 [Patescibacteria group bacterium]|jgi:hypothetical protein